MLNITLAVSKSVNGVSSRHNSNYDGANTNRPTNGRHPPKKRFCYPFKKRSCSTAPELVPELSVNFIHKDAKASQQKQPKGYIRCNFGLSQGTISTGQ
jgi:hypothetical protein